MIWINSGWHNVPSLCSESHMCHRISVQIALCLSCRVAFTYIYTAYWKRVKVHRVIIRPRLSCWCQQEHWRSNYKSHSQVSGVPSWLAKFKLLNYWLECARPALRGPSSQFIVTLSLSFHFYMNSVTVQLYSIMKIFHYCPFSIGPNQIMGQL